MAEIEIDPELLPEQHELAPVRSRLESPAGGTDFRGPHATNAAWGRGLDRLPPPFFPSRARKGTRQVGPQTIAKPAPEPAGARAGEGDAASVPEDAFIPPDAPIRRESSVPVGGKRTEVDATRAGDDSHLEDAGPTAAASGELSSLRAGTDADRAERLADRLEDLAGRLRVMGASALLDASDHDPVDVALRSLLASFLTAPGRDGS